MWRARKASHSEEIPTSAPGMALRKSAGDSASMSSNRERILPILGDSCPAQGAGLETVAGFSAGAIRSVGEVVKRRTAFLPSPKPSPIRTRAMQARRGRSNGARRVFTERWTSLGAPVFKRHSRSPTPRKTNPLPQQNAVGYANANE